MNDFTDAFREVAEAALSQFNKKSIELVETKKKIIFMVKAPHKNGFDYRLECFEYGIYPTVDGWNGAPWDITMFSPKELKNHLSSFIKSLLHDAVLTIYYSNNKPYKWSLQYQLEGECVFEENKTMFFNWFGTKTQRRLCNGTVL